jgi:class 3 adenylate cyclase
MVRAMHSIAEWLASIGLGEYAERFAENAVDFAVLRDLTEQDLKDLGVKLGHRRKMLRAISELDQAAHVPAALAATKPSARQEAERRQLSILFCDLVGSTALTARLDAEDMWRVIASYHDCISDVVNRYGGKIARYMGDGVLIYFGYPQAREDDAVQAVRAALVLVDAIATLKTNVDAALQARIGLATGTVVVSELLIDDAPVEQATVGETPNLAARLQADLSTNALAYWRALQLPRPRLCCAQRLGPGHISLAGDRDTRRGEPLRGDAREQAAAAVRSRRGDRAAVAQVAKRNGRRRPRGAAYRGAGHRQVAHCA